MMRLSPLLPSVLSAALLVSCGDTQDLVLADLPQGDPVTAAQAEPVEEVSSWEPQPFSKIGTPEALRDAVLYRVNVRQFSEAGDLAGVTAQLPRLAELGVDVVSLMPVHPIGEDGRQGSLGRVEAVADHTKVGAEFGTTADLRALTAEAERLDMSVVLGWVADRAAPDHVWAERGWIDERPQWSRARDTAPLDYRSVELREAMAEAMRGWLELGVAGFDVDGADTVPLDFWEEVRRELEPSIMVADSDNLALARAAFDVLTDSELKSRIQTVARDEADLREVTSHLADGRGWPDDVIRMVPTSDAFQNLRRGTPNTVYGFAYEPAVVLSFVGEGMPMIYTGQEAGNRNRLDAGDRDPVSWRDHPTGELMGRLAQLKADTPALHNGTFGAPAVPLATSAPRQVLAFSRTLDGTSVVALMNFSQKRTAFTIRDARAQGIYEDFRTGRGAAIVADEERALPAWGWQVLVRRPEADSTEDDAQ